MGDSYTIREGDRLWPLIQAARDTHIDDLTDERIRELVIKLESWRLSNADGSPLQIHPSHLMGLRGPLKECAACALNVELDRYSLSRPCRAEAEEPDADHTPHGFVEAGYDTCRYCGNSAAHSVHATPAVSSDVGAGDA